MANLLNGTTINGSTAWHQGNDGSGSGLDADLLDGYQASTLTRTDAYVSVYVGGDANTYYPVTFTLAGHYGFQRYSISRQYNWTAPTTWNNSTHKGGLTLTLEATGDSAWGGNDKTIRVIQFAESYSNMVGGLGLATGNAGAGNIVVWLRGGYALYRIQTPAGSETSITVHLDGFTANNGAVFSPRTSRVTSEIYSRFPVRGNSSLYVGENAVWHAGNDGSGSGLDADTLDGLHASAFATNNLSNVSTLPSSVVTQLKGDKGDKGDTGATGPQGPQGPQGPAGPGSDVDITTTKSSWTAWGNGDIAHKGCLAVGWSNSHAYLQNLPNSPFSHRGSYYEVRTRRNLVSIGGAIFTGSISDYEYRACYSCGGCG